MKKGKGYNPKCVHGIRFFDKAGKFIRCYQCHDNALRGMKEETLLELIKEGYLGKIERKE